MKIELEKMMGSTWLESIKRINEQTRLAALAFQESEAFSAMQKYTEPVKLASLAISQSQISASVSELAERSKLASIAFRETEALNSIRRYTESTRLADLLRQESDAIKSMRAAMESASLSSINLSAIEDALKLQGIAHTSQLASIAQRHSEAFKEIDRLSNMASFKALSGLNNSPFPDISSLHLDREKNVRQQVEDESLLELDSQISEEISSQNDFNALSEKTKSILIYLYHYYFLPVFLSCLSAYIMANAIEATKELESVASQEQVRKFVRSPQARFDKSVLKGFRITKVDALNFRELPSLRSRVITTLPIGTLVEIVDKRDRSWLLVEVEIEGKLEQGWVARRYTTYFK